MKIKVLIQTKIIFADGTVRLSVRRPRVVIHSIDRDPISCVSVIHAAETLETLLGRRVPKTALNNQAMWLSRELLNNDMHITFPGSHRMRFPQEPADRAVYNSTHTTQRPLHEGYHLES